MKFKIVQVTPPVSTKNVEYHVYRKVMGFWWRQYQEYSDMFDSWSEVLVFETAALAEYWILSQKPDKLKTIKEITI